MALSTALCDGSGDGEGPGACHICVRLANRLTLSVFVRIYDNIRDSSFARNRLWASVALECSTFSRLLLLIFSPLPLPWHPVVSAVGASKSGMGVMAFFLNGEIVRRTGRWHERWKRRVEVAGSANRLSADA